MEFSLIKKIIPEDIKSWQNKIFITLDMEWAIDEVLSDTIDILEKYSIPATWFVTHQTELLNRLRSNSQFELGIHPNFNFLLNGDFRYGKNFKEVLSYYKKIVPEAISVRSHSLTQSSLFVKYYESENIIFDCNMLIPFESNINLQPYYHTKKLIRVPHFWEDDTRHLYSDNLAVKKYLDNDCIKVFDFHPIHIFLNTDALDLYNKVKPFNNNFDKLKEFRNTENSGIRNFFLDLINFKK